MDLNKLFFKHQVALMRAAEADRPDERDSHRARADELASCIGNIQRGNGARAPALIPAAQL